MTKRIIALALVAVMALASLVACEEAATTTTPDATTTGTKAPETTKVPETTKAPETTATNNGGNTPVPPVTTETPVTEEDPFAQWGGMDAMFYTGSMYGSGYECWPFEGNDSFCARAFWQLCVWLGKDEADLTENVTVPADYKYTWKLWVVDGDADYSDCTWDGPYTASIETVYDGGDQVIYRLQTSDCPEGDPCAKMELGKSYSILIQALEGKGDDAEPLGFFIVNQEWSNHIDAQYKAYKGYWEKRNRADGYKAADQDYTDDDKAYAESLGLTIDGKWNGEA